MINKSYFGTDGIRGKVGIRPITPDFILKLGWVAGKILAKNGSKKIVIGKDTRISSCVLESALEAGILAAGVSVDSIGVMPTPAVAYFTRIFLAEAGIVLSASHNPFFYNGIKFFSIHGTKINYNTEKKIERAIIKRNISCVSSLKLGKINYISDAEYLYINFCKSTFPQELNLKKFTIVLDCANGSTCHIAPKVLCDLGAHVITISCDPDGVNINKNCGTTDIRVLKSRVLSEKADLGIAFDGDGDRIIMIDHLGNIVNGDYILYIIANNSFYLSNHKCYGVVGTIMSNMGLEISLNKLGIQFIRSEVGDRCILEKLKEKSWIFGAENSGHVLLLNKTTTGDGIVTGLQVLTTMVRKNVTLYDLCKDMKYFPQTLVNIRIDTTKKDPFKHIMVKKVLNYTRQQLQNHGRIILRKSGTEPLIRLMIEGKDKKQVSFLAKYITNIIKSV